MAKPPTPLRCDWAEGSDPMRDYHDREWGVPQRDERALFELLTLEGAQAGLSWSTILAKREGYRAAFAGFDPARVARFDQRRVERLLADASIVRHRGKIESVIANARAIVALGREGRTLAHVVWSHVGDAPVRNRWRSAAEVPAQTPQSKQLAKTLSGLGFRFVGPTTCYAFMQAAGLVNDHLASCPRHGEVASMR